MRPRLSLGERMSKSPVEHYSVPASRITLLAVFTALLVGLLGAAPASAAPAKITKVFGGPITTGGACNPDATATKTDASEFTDFCVSFRATNDEGPEGVDLKSQVVDTPKGFAGVADAYPQCTDAQFNKASEANAACPANTQMGQVAAKIRARPSTDPGTIALLQLAGAADGNGIASLAPTGAVFNLEHSENEVARLGIDLRPTALGGALDQPNVKIIVRVTLRPSPDVGLRSIIDDMPNKAHVEVGLIGLNNPNSPLAVDEFNLLFWGPQRGAMPKPFGFLGANCSDAQTTKIKATDYSGGTTGADSPTYQLTDCDDPNIQFKPSVGFSTSENRPDVTTETSVSVKFGTSDNPNYQVAGPKKTVVTLPNGLSFSGQIASGANGLPLCKPEQFAQFDNAASTCPDATAVGTVSFESPVQSRKLTGKVFLGAQPQQYALPDIYIEAQLGPAADAPRVKLIGHLTVDDQNRIVTSLDDLPEVPVTEFLLTFRGGDQAAVVTPPTCGDYTGGLSAFGHNKPSTAVDSTAPYSINQDCDAVKNFAPSVGIELDNKQAGASGPVTATVNRPDRSERLGKAQVELPAGLLSNLKGVPECSLDAAKANACPADTKIGSASSLAGVGPAPYKADGTVYLTQRQEGAVAGIAISFPVVFGEVNLGTLAVLGRIEIRAGDLGLRFVADVPERFAGVPLNIRSFSVRLDREGFPLNPTNCGVLTSTSKITSLAGTVADAPASIQVSGCDKLKFEPQIDAAVTGTTSALGRPNVAVRVQNAEGASALRQTFVTLPKGIGVDLAQIPRGCAVDEFLGGGCQRTSIIGKVAASLSITDERLAGDLYLLKAAPGKTLPGLGIAFTGRFAARLTGENAVDSKTGQLVTSFAALPDLPLTDFQIDITGGAGGPVIATKALCESTTVDFNSRFVAHSGPTVSRVAKTYCGVPLGQKLPKVQAKLGGVRKGKPTLVLTATAPSGMKMTRLDLALPKGYTVSKSRAKSRKSIVLKKLTTKGKVSSKRTGSTKLRVSLPSKGTTKAQLLTRTGAISIKSSKLRKSKKKVIVLLTVRYTGGVTATMPIRLTPR